MLLPNFLRPLPSAFNEQSAPHISAVFEHHSSIGNVHALWWPPKLADFSPEIVILFIPGNPGLLDFYIPFLSALHGKDTTSRLGILGHSHLGHTPYPGMEAGAHTLNRGNVLPRQIDSALEAFDALESTYGSQCKIIVIGHSVGAWISLQIVKQRSSRVFASFLLFPTISGIGSTPNGRRLSWCFGPTPRYIISMSSYLTRVLPSRLLSLLFPEWPVSQLAVLQTLLDSPLVIRACLAMAHEEMEAICDLDLLLLQQFRDRLWFYYAEQDDWVAEQKDLVLKALKPNLEYVRVAHGRRGIPHAFCINHSEEIAEQCSDWLKELLT